MERRVLGGNRIVPSASLLAAAGQTVSSTGTGIHPTMRSDPRVTQPEGEFVGELYSSQ
jgi:hypothetical protein